LALRLVVVTVLAVEVDVDVDVDVDVGAKADAEATKRENKPIENLIVIIISLVNRPSGIVLCRM
jgi:hypothetical protein